MDYERRLVELGIALPEATPPTSNYANAVLAGDLLFLTGQGLYEFEGAPAAGKVGRDIPLDLAVRHARQIALILIAMTRAELGTLNKVRRIVRIFGLVNATDDFTEHKTVLNGCSDVFCDIFGPEGVHARFTGGAPTMPFGISMQIEAVVQVTP